MANRPIPPVIVIGMHRSGTSMITRMLERLGLFIGLEKDENDEALLFQRLNDWLLRQSGGAWDHPAPIRYLLENAEIRALAAGYLRGSLSSPRAAGYLGWPRFVRQRDIASLRDPWGWKDPRTTFTLPVWLDVFPDARIVHIQRHGVDVAQSLFRRNGEVERQMRAKYARRRALYRLQAKRAGFTPSLRSTTLEGCFSLWEEYLGEARRAVAAHPGQTMELSYEEFLERPGEMLLALVRFCGLETTEARARALASGAAASRAMAFAKDPALLAFAEGVAPRLAAFGYSAGRAPA
jgi:hypothetical protein